MKNFIIIISVLFTTFSAMGQSQVVTSKIWNQGYYCTLPDGFVYPQKYKCDVCSERVVTCKEFKAPGDAVTVWVNVQNAQKTTIKLKSKFKNIYLLTAKGKKIFPIALYCYNNPFVPDKELPQLSLAKKFKNINYTIEFEKGKNIDLLIVFPKASPNSKIVIEDFLESNI